MMKQKKSVMLEEVLMKVDRTMERVEDKHASLSEIAVLMVCSS